MPCVGSSLRKLLDGEQCATTSFTLKMRMCKLGRLMLVASIKPCCRACMQLGFLQAGSVSSGGPGPRSALPIVMDDVACTGTEAALQQCAYAKTANCLHYEGKELDVAHAP